MTDEYMNFCAKVWQEVQRADNLHGSWESEPTIECMNAIEDEVHELYTAVLNEDIHGKHGILAEAVQVAATAYKLIRKVSKKEI